MSASAMEGLPTAPTPRSAAFAVLQRIGRSLMTPGRDPEADADEGSRRDRAAVAQEPGPAPRDPDPQGGAAPA